MVTLNCQVMTLWRDALLLVHGLYDGYPDDLNGLRKAHGHLLQINFSSKVRAQEEMWLSHLPYSGCAWWRDALNCGPTSTPVDYGALVEIRRSFQWLFTVSINLLQVCQSVRWAQHLKNILNKSSRTLPLKIFSVGRQSFPQCWSRYFVVESTAEKRFVGTISTDRGLSDAAYLQKKNQRWISFTHSETRFIPQ